jgi:hypothetical protein
MVEEYPRILMQRGALGITKTTEERSLSDLKSTNLHELLTQEQCALALQKISKMHPASTNAPGTE